MKIMSLKEFYKKEEKDKIYKDISLYISYLAKIKKELMDSLEDVSFFGLSEKIAKDLRDKIKLVEGLENVISNSYVGLITNSVDSLTGEILDAIGSEYLSSYLKKREELQKQHKAKICEQLEAKEPFYERGYKDSFYEARDTEVFFSDIKPAREYAKYLISPEMHKVGLISAFSLVFCLKANEARPEIDEIIKRLSPASIEDICKELADMVYRFRRIVELVDSDDALDELVSSFVSLNGMGKVFGAKSVEECETVLKEFQRQIKLNTEFFEWLPDNLKKSIREEGFDVDGVYGSLLNIYADYKENGRVSMPKEAFDEALESEINDLESQISTLDEIIKDLRTIISDRESFVKYIKENVQKNGEEALSLESIMKYIQTGDSFQNGVKSNISELENKISELNSMIGEIDGIISDESTTDFEILKARNDLRIMNNIGESATETGIHPNYEAEKRRLEQYKIIVDTMKNLNSIKSQIEAIDNDRSIINNLNGSNKQKKSILLYQYQEFCKNCYKKLDRLGLLRIVVAQSYLDKESEILNKPTSFEKIFNGGKTPHYQVTPELYEELKSKNIIPDDMSMKELTNLFDQSYELGKALFATPKVRNGIYEFSLSWDSYGESIVIQEKIAKLYEDLYNKRKETRENLIRSSQLPFSSNMISMIERLGIDERDVSQEVLIENRKRLTGVINEVEKKLAELRESLNVSENFGNEATIEDIQTYYLMLDGFYESTIPAKEFSKIILKQHENME